MRIFIVFVLFHIRICAVGQNFNMEEFHREFSDTIIAENMDTFFRYSLNGNLEISFKSKIYKDTSIVIVQYINKDTMNNLWIGDLGGFENFNHGKWTVITMPDFNYHSPMYFLCVMPGDTIRYIFKRKGLAETFYYSTYLMSNYIELTTNLDSDNYNPIFFNHEGYNGLEIPFESYPKDGIIWLSVKGFPVSLKRNNAKFTVSRRF